MIAFKLTQEVTMLHPVIMYAVDNQSSEVKFVPSRL